MKRLLSILIASIVLASMAISAMARPVNEPYPLPKDTYSSVNPPASKNLGDSIVSDVNASTAIYTAIRTIAMDPTSGAAFVVYRDNSGAYVNYRGTLDKGQNWTIFDGLNLALTCRYPSAMADPVQHQPWLIFNTGIGIDPTKGLYCAKDTSGYNGGNWIDPVRIDSLGAGSGTEGLYVGSLYRGTNGVVHCIVNYWGTNRNGALYYRSTDSGATWNVTTPRYPTNLLFYNMQGTSDSTDLFGVGNPVIRDSVIDGYSADVAIWGSPTGDTLMIGACGLQDAADTVTDRGYVRFWYRMSYDAGLTWTPFAYAPYGGWIGWQSRNYGMGIALDKTGYPHFVTSLIMGQDTMTGNYDTTNSGLVDYHQTSGGWVSTLIHPTDTLGTHWPRFANVGIDPDGNLSVAYQDTMQAGIMDIWTAYNPGTDVWQTKKVTTDNQAYRYPHFPCLLPAHTDTVPVWYQNTGTYLGFVSWNTLGTTGVTGEPGSVAVSPFQLLQNHPNPSFNAPTSISFNLTKPAGYELTVFNIIGQAVRTYTGKGRAGFNTVVWDSRNNEGTKVSAGVYLYQLRSDGCSAIRKLTVVR